MTRVNDVQAGFRIDPLAGFREHQAATVGEAAARRRATVAGTATAGSAAGRVARDVRADVARSFVSLRSPKFRMLEDVRSIRAPTEGVVEMTRQRTVAADDRIRQTTRSRVDGIVGNVLDVEA